MNWFTKSYVAHYPHDLKKKEVERWGGCEHVEKDPSTLYNISYENDSFGREGYCLCEECHKEAQRQRDEEKRMCDDCSQIFERRDLTAWTPYDYCPADGDVLIYICVGCQTKDKHSKRVQHNQEAYRSEMGDQDLD